MNTNTNTNINTDANILNINTIAQAFTKTVIADGATVEQAKKDSSLVIREAIPKFDYSIKLDLDLEDEKVRIVISQLVTDTIQKHIQSIDRNQLWSKETIADNFEREAASFTAEKLYEIVCLNASATFGLKAFINWVKTLLIPAIEVGTKRELTEAQKKTIMTAVKDGKRMSQQTLERVLKWIELYGTELADADKAVDYLTNTPTDTINDLESLGI